MRLRRRPKGRRPEYTEGDAYYLQHGHRDLFRGMVENGTWDEQRAAWRALDWILDDWIEDGPGTRPWAWWHFDATEPRRLVSGEEHPDDGYSPYKFLPPEGSSGAWHQQEWPAVLKAARQHEEECLAACAPLGTPGRRGYYLGEPASITGGSRGELPSYEPEHVYLERLELLTEHERATLPEIKREHRFEGFAFERHLAYRHSLHDRKGLDDTRARQNRAAYDAARAGLEMRGELEAALAYAEDSLWGSSVPAGW